MIDDDGALDIPFEFERKFLVKNLPAEVREAGSTQTIVQAYVFADEGYAIRVRMALAGACLDFPAFDEEVDRGGAYERRLLKAFLAANDPEKELVRASVAVKSPPINGERYEKEVDIEPVVAYQIISRSSTIVAKNRYSLWYDEDGWEFDVFGGRNAGLIVAECERATPVVNLKIPEFCYTEVTGDLRFTNDYLASNPFEAWGASYWAEIEAQGPTFLEL